MWGHEGDHLRIKCLFLNSDVPGVLRKLSTFIVAIEAASSKITGSSTFIMSQSLILLYDLALS